MSARVQQDCMQCVNGIRSERGEECKRVRIVCNARMAYGARRGVHACERIVCNARTAYGARRGVQACEDCLQCANGIQSEERSARVREDCLQCANNGIRSEVWSARVREDCLQCRIWTFFEPNHRCQIVGRVFFCFI